MSSLYMQKNTKKVESKPKGSQYDQGEGGAFKTRKSGSNLDQGPANGARSSRKKTSARGGEIPANVPKGSSRQGDHTTPPRAWVAGPRTADRQGGTIKGHDRPRPQKTRGSKFDPKMN